MRWSWATGFAAFCVIAGGGYYWFAGGNTPSNNSGVDSVQRTKAPRSLVGAAESKPRSLVGAAESKPRSLVEAAESKRKAEATACRNKFSDIASKGGITFKTGGAAFDKRALGALDELVRTAKSCVNIVITVEGHTDSIGSEEANKSLSQQRAQAVVDYFIGSGLDANLLNAVGYGGTKPIATNDTAHGRAQNRRIHFTVR
jgi:outer membrane protein OmpA-like peptidoglycan-associated protein